MKLKIRSEHSEKTSCFELQLSFRLDPESFFQPLQQHSRNLGGALDLADYREEIVIYYQSKYIEENVLRGGGIMPPP